VLQQLLERVEPKKPEAWLRQVQEWREQQPLTYPHDDLLWPQFILEQINWELCGDPYFYPNRHLGPRLIEETRQDGGEEYWIYYNTTKFSGKKLAVKPGAKFECEENGVYSLLVWRGEGKYAGVDVKAGDPARDELVVTHDAAVRPHTVENTSSEEMQVIKFFGPDINMDVPMIEPYMP